MLKFRTVFEEKIEHFETWKVVFAFKIGDALIMTLFSWQEYDVGAGDWNALETKIADEGNMEATLQKLLFKLGRTRSIQF